MRRIFLIVLIILIFVTGLTGSFFAGAYFGYDRRPAIEKVTNLYNKEEAKPAEVDFAPFWKAWSILDEKFVDAKSTTTANTISDDARVWGAIEGLAQSFGDPYTVFLPPKEKEQFQSDIEGSFGGVGMEIGIKDGQLVVISALPNTPAKIAGIKAGDRIFKINDEVATKLNVSDAVDKIRGKKGTAVNISILRGDENKELKFNIVRDTINIPTIETELRSDDVFVIRLFSFPATAPNLFRQALREFVDSGTDKMIIDLRGNPGGFLDAAIHISSWFLDKDKVIVTEVRGKGEEELVHKSYGFDVFTDKLKLVILIDQGSASASEIMAGALSEQGKAILIGQKTFGKGSVQELIPVTDKTSLKVTIAHWFTPLGHSISENGLEPDIKVELTADDVKNAKDPQLDRAVKYLLTGK